MILLYTASILSLIVCSNDKSMKLEFVMPESQCLSHILEIS